MFRLAIIIHIQKSAQRLGCSVAPPQGTMCMFRTEPFLCSSGRPLRPPKVTTRFRIRIILLVGGPILMVAIGAHSSAYPVRASMEAIQETVRPERKEQRNRAVESAQETIRLNPAQPNGYYSLSLLSTDPIGKENLLK